ncbi:MAG TPA: bifunctional DNA-formamidopyrimidine glycosylase/DNA-(apurinic or apyrimidinic site) lyase [Gemmatimonadota bacterium]|nr:bifunctional DNA-formamidopyrimidine glycosylase/DNA-(apurinic or apyrimidinic site) lyase [Gemmatimonadota bacterium]
MPELPEVETIRRDLAPEIGGRTITAARIHQPDIVLPPDDPDRFARRVTGRRIERVDRRAKYLLLRLAGRVVVQVQLRMTGRFAVGETLPDPEEFSHVAAELDLDDGRTLFYDDVRRLGGLRTMDAETWDGEAARLGPEPLEGTFTTDALGRELAGRKAPVKNLLLDQRRVAGLGNIYAAEALHAAGIDPRRPGGSLSGADLAELHGAIRRTLEAALEGAGTTFRDYRAVNGRSGRFQERLRVYGREGEPCRRCGTAVERIVQAGRSTFFCPGCQS